MSPINYLDFDHPERVRNFNSLDIRESLAVKYTAPTESSGVPGHYAILLHQHGRTWALSAYELAYRLIHLQHLAVFLLTSTPGKRRQILEEIAAATGRDYSGPKIHDDRIVFLLKNRYATFISYEDRNFYKLVERGGATYSSPDAALLMTQLVNIGLLLLSKPDRVPALRERLKLSRSGDGPAASGTIQEQLDIIGERVALLTRSIPADLPEQLAALRLQLEQLASK